MRILVTGATGHIGVNLLRALTAEGREVRALVHRDDSYLNGLDGVERVTGDIRDPDAVRRAVKDVEMVYHLAAHISIRRDDARIVEECNVAGVKNMVAACLEAGVRRLVHFSSIHALSTFPVDGLVDETRQLTSEREGVPAYDRSKAAGEREVQAGIVRGLDAVIVNPTGVIGPYDYRPSAMGSALLSFYRRSLPATVAGGFNFVDVRDVVQGALAAAARGRTGERYLLSGEWISTPDLARIIEEVTGSRAPSFVCPMWLARVAAPFVEGYSIVTRTPALFTAAALHALRNHRHITYAKAKAELGYSPRPLRESIADTFAWFRESRMI